jgi:hypothetical protein
MSVVHEDGRLVLRPLTGGSVPLVPTADGGFRLPHESGTSIRFARDGDGDDVLLVHGLYLERGRAWVAELRLRAVRAALQIMQYTVVLFALWLLLWLARPVIGRAVPPSEVALLAPPALASIAFFAFVIVAQSVAIDTLMTRNPTTMALCALTIAFAMFSGVAVANAVAALAREGLGPRALVRLIAMLASSTCFAMTLWLLVHGIIGLRTWSY